MKDLQTPAQRHIYRFRVQEAGWLLNVLADHLPFSKTHIKKILNRGAVWIRRSNRRLRRIRRAKAWVRPGDFLEVYYDPALEKLQLPNPELLADHWRFTVWYKPPGVLSQGTKFGDHTSLLRHATRSLQRPAFLIHRLDRAASGLLLLAHTRTAAAALSALFREHRVQKVYRAEVSGNVTAQLPATGYFDTPIDGKPAQTFYTVDQYDAEQDISLLTLTPQTGRLHQIRRHLAAAGFPIIGDRTYGGIPSPTGWLHLTAVHLSFRDPETGKVQAFTLPEDKILWSSPPNT